MGLKNPGRAIILGILLNMPFPPKVFDWQKVKEAYVMRETRPSLEELSKEFGCTSSRISQVSTAENWLSVRTERLEKQLANAEAGKEIMEAILSDKAIRTAIRDAMLHMLHQLGALAQRLNTTKADSSLSNTLGSLTFSLLNCANAAKTAGIVSPLGKLPAGAADNAPDFLQQINVTVNAIKAEESAAKAKEIPAEVG